MSEVANSKRALEQLQPHHRLQKFGVSRDDDSAPACHDAPEAAAHIAMEPVRDIVSGDAVVDKSARQKAPITMRILRKDRHQPLPVWRVCAGADEQLVGVSANDEHYQVQEIFDLLAVEASLWGHER